MAFVIACAFRPTVSWTAWMVLQALAARPESSHIYTELDRPLKWYPCHSVMLMMLFCITRITKAP